MKADLSRDAAEPSSGKEASRSSLRRAARGSVLNLFGAAVGAVSTFGLTVVIARGLDKSDAGVFFITTSLFLIATSVGQLGTDSGLVYFLSRARALSHPELIRSYVRAAVWPVLATSLVMGTGIFFFASSIASVISPGHVPLAAAALQVLAFFVPCAVLENVALSATRGLAHMRPNVVVEQIGRPSLQLALVATVVYASGLDVAWAWAWALPYAGASIAAWWWLRRLVRQAVPAPVLREPSRRMREFWSFTGPRSVASVIQIAMQRLDVILVGALAGAPAAAVYAAATRFVVLGQLARLAVSQAVQPHIAASLARQDHDEIVHLYQTSTAWLMAVTWPIYLVLLVNGGPLLSVFGPGYDAGSTVLVLLAISMLVATGCGDVDIVLVMAGRTRSSLVNIAVAFTLNVGLDVWLIPEHGILGAAIGWAVGIAAKNLMALVQVAAVLKLHPVGPATILVGCASVASFGGCLLLGRFWVGDGVSGLLAGCIAACVVYGATLWWGRGVLEVQSLTRRRKGTSSPAAS